MSECKHTRVIQFFYTENLEPSGLWACAECNLKFVPIDRELELEEENEKLREALNSVVYAAEQGRVWDGSTWEYPPLHPVHYVPVLEKARAVLQETER
jgi:hypothetical protein